MKFEGTQVNIPIKGIMRAGTDNLCADGAMNEVIGMEYKDGSWLPYKESEEEWMVRYYTPRGWAPLPNITRVYLHKTSDGSEHYLFLQGNNNVLYSEVVRHEEKRLIDVGVPITGEVTDVEFIGNMLCVSTPRGMEHYLWTENNYISASESLFPSNDISIRVSAGFMYDDNLLAGIKYSSKIEDTKATLDSGEWIYGKKDTIMANMIAALGEMRDRGGMSGYLLGCVAYRMKNGEVVCASNPVLLAKPLDVFSAQQSPSTSSYVKEVFFSGENELSDKFNRLDGGEKEIYSIFPSGVGPQTRGEAYVVFGSDLIAISVGDSIFRHDIDMDDGVQEIRNSGRLCTYGFQNTLQLILQCIESSPLSEDRGKPIVQCEKAYIPSALVSVLCDKELNTEGKRRWLYNAFVAGNGLQFKVNNSAHLSELKKAGVSSVCFFISQEVSPLIIKEKEEDYEKMFHGTYGLFDIWDYDNTSYTGKMGCSIGVKRKSAAKIIEELIGIKSLYLVQETPIDKILENEDWEYIDLSGKLGDNLVVREQLSLTAFDYTKTFSGKLSAYNYRLHQYDYKQELFSGYMLPSFGHHGGFGQYQEEYFEAQGSQYLKWEAKVTIKDDSGETRVTTFDNTALSSLIKSLSPIIIYPDTNAESITIAVYLNTSSGSPEKTERTFYFSNDSGLGFAYYIDPDLRPIVLELTTGDVPSEDLPSDSFMPYNTTRIYHNGLKVSDVAYPSYFPAQYTYRLGNEKIIGLARLTIPMSQDNFGNYSLIVFCKDGIYSLRVDASGNGAYTSQAFVSPEVCLNTNSICEIGGAVFFAGDKGLMILTGENNVELYAPQLNGVPRFLPKSEQSKEARGIYRKMIDDPKILSKDGDNFGDSISYSDFKDFIVDEGTHLIYISNKNKLLAYNGTMEDGQRKYDYSYFIDIPTRNTTKLAMTALCDNGNIIGRTIWENNTNTYTVHTFGYLSEEDDDIPCLIQSRPIKVQQDDKCSYRVVLTGYFDGIEDNWADIVVLGSLDADHWRVIGVKEKKLVGGFHNLGCLTERGSWKYLMFIFAGKLTNDSHIDSVDITVDGRYNNKKR